MKPMLRSSFVIPIALYGSLVAGCSRRQGPDEGAEPLLPATQSSQLRTITYLDQADSSGHLIGFFSIDVNGQQHRIGDVDFEIYPTKLLSHQSGRGFTTIDDLDGTFFYSEYVAGALVRSQEVTSYQVSNAQPEQRKAYVSVSRDMGPNGSVVTIGGRFGKWRIANKTWTGGVDTEGGVFLHKWSPDGSVLLIGIKGEKLARVPPGYPIKNKLVFDDYKEDCLYLVRLKDRKITRVGEGFAAVWDTDNRIVIARYGAIFRPVGALMLPSALSEVLEIASGRRTHIGEGIIPMGKMADGPLIWLESDAEERNLRLTLGPADDAAPRQTVTTLHSPYYTWPQVQAHGVITDLTRDVVAIGN